MASRGSVCGIAMSEGIKVKVSERKYPAGVCCIASQPDIALSSQFFPVGVKIGEEGRKSMQKYLKVMEILREGGSYRNILRTNGKVYGYICEGPACKGEKIHGVSTIVDNKVAVCKPCVCPKLETQFPTKQALMEHDFLQNLDIPHSGKGSHHVVVKNKALQEALVYMVTVQNLPVVYFMNAVCKYGDDGYGVYATKNSRGCYLYDIGLVDGSLYQILIRVKNHCQKSKSNDHSTFSLLLF